MNKQRLPIDDTLRELLALLKRTPMISPTKNGKRRDIVLTRIAEYVTGISEDDTYDDVNMQSNFRATQMPHQVTTKLWSVDFDVQDKD